MSDTSPSTSSSTPPKTEPGTIAKSPAKRRHDSQPSSGALNIKAAPINPAWASEVAKAYGLTGPLADAVAEQLSSAVSARLEKITRSDKLSKLVKEAVIGSIGTVR